MNIANENTHNTQENLEAQINDNYENDNLYQEKDYSVKNDEEAAFMDRLIEELNKIVRTTLMLFVIDVIG